MPDVCEEIRRRLYERRDEGYREFTAVLVPEVDETKIIGVRMPDVRGLAKEMGARDDIAGFLTALPHYYLEENNVHGAIIASMRDHHAAVTALEGFLPYVDNWATCDMITPAVFKKHVPELIGDFLRWAASDKTYVVRFGVRMLMAFCLDGEYSPEFPSIVADIRPGDYYVDMMRAWYFAKALSKRYEDVLPFIEGRRLDTWTHNKTIQKAVESRRIAEERKMYLKALKI
jgi:3-methyladenine DNA glycosylase AlkD